MPCRFRPGTNRATQHFHFELLSGMFVKMLLTWSKPRNTAFHFELLSGLSVNLLSTWRKSRNTAFSIA
jgi:hypothetical protein